MSKTGPWPEGAYCWQGRETQHTSYGNVSQNEVLEERRTFSIPGGAGIGVHTPPRESEESCWVGGGGSGKNVPGRGKVQCKGTAWIRG